MDQTKQSENNNIKNELYRHLIGFQEKLVKIIKAEERLSQLPTINEPRLKKQKEARYAVSEKIEPILHQLLDMGETFRIKRKKRIKK